MKSRDRKQPDASRPSRWRGIGLVALVALMVAAPLVPSDAISPREGKGVMLIMLRLILLVLWCCVAFIPPRSALRWNRFDVVAGAFLAWMAISGVVMLPAGNPRYSLNMIWEWGSLGATWFLVRQWCDTTRLSRAVCAVMMGLTLCLAVHSYHQFFYSLPRDRAEFERDPEGVLRRAGFDPTEGSQERILYTNRVKSVEPFATFSLTNSLAGFLVPWFLIVATMAAWKLVHRHLEPSAMWPWLSAALLIAGSVLLTKSRSATVAIICGMLVLAIWMASRRFPGILRFGIVTILLGAALVAGGFYVGALDIEVFTESKKSLGYRLEYWQATAGMIADHWLFGVGAGNFREYYANYKLPYSSEMVLDPHNFMLEIAATAGLPAAIFFFLWLAGTAWDVLWFRQSEPNETRPIEGGVAAKVRVDDPGPYRVYWGALGGLAVGYVAGFLAGIPPEISVLLIGFVVAAIFLYGIHPWVMGGQMKAWVPLLAAMGLLVNLLAAGGIGFPGVSQSLWLLVALAPNLTPGKLRFNVLPSGSCGGILLASVLLLGLFWFTGFGPVLQEPALAGKTVSLLQQGRLDEAQTVCQTWCREDPWSPSPYWQLALIQLRKYTLSGDVQFARPMELAIQETVVRDPKSYLRHRDAGNLNLRIWRGSGHHEFLETAIDHYRKSVDLFPNGNFGHAQLAWSLYLLKNLPAARQEAEEALRLNSLNPHLDQKLAQQKIVDYPPSRPGRHAAPPEEENAELVMLRLRTTERENVPTKRADDDTPAKGD